MAKTANTHAKRKARGRPFANGNPGRPPGSRNKTTVALEQLLEGQGEAIVAKVAEKALEGDRMAMRLVFERVMGARRERSLTTWTCRQSVDGGLCQSVSGYSCSNRRGEDDSHGRSRNDADRRQRCASFYSYRDRSADQSSRRVRVQPKRDLRRR